MTRSPGPLAALCITGAFAAFPLPVRADTGRLGRDVVPTQESVHLRLDADQPDFSGSVRIEIEVRKKTDALRFHAQNLTLDRVVLSGAKTPPTDLTHTTGENGLVIAHAPAALATGAYTLEIDFRGRFRTDATGLYRMDYLEDGYAFTQFEPDDARFAFPCWDEPEFKIPFQITLTVPQSHMAVSNTPVERETAGEGWVTHVFRKTKPLPTYLLAVATGPLEFVPMPGLGVPGGIVTVKGQSHLTELAIDMTPPLLAGLESWFGTPYPFEQLNLIAIPEYWPGAMEHPGAITFSDNILLQDPRASTVAQKRTLARVLTHELAHMWFGDLVTMMWWDDLWLNEAFADWMGDRVADQVFPQYAIAASERQSAQKIMDMDARPSTSAIRRPVDSTENLLEDVGLSYNKGKTVLSMFESYVGPGAFQKAIRAYLTDHAWGSATAADLWAALDKASGSGRAVSDAMAGFLEQPGFPIVTVEPLGDKQVRISQERFHNFGVTVDAQTWKIPVTLKFADAGGVHTETVLLTGDSRTVTLPTDGPPAWIYPNASGSGYYRWMAPPAMVTKMAAAAPEALDAQERIEILGNTNALLQSGVLDGESYLKVLHGFSEDTEPMVLSALLDYLQAVQVAFVTEDLEDAFALYIRRTLGPSLARIGLEKRPDEDERVSILRPKLLDRLGREGRDPDVRAFATERAAAYLADPQSVDPAIATVCLGLASLEGGRAMYDDCRRRFEDAQTPGDRQRFLSVLGMSLDPALWDQGLDYALHGPLRPNETLVIPTSIAKSPAGQRRVFEWMLANYTAITDKLPPDFAAFLPFMASGCEQERLLAAQAFFAQPEHNPPGTQTQLRRVGDQVTDCLSLRGREGEAVARYMKSLAGGE